MRPEELNVAIAKAIENNASVIIVNNYNHGVSIAEAQEALLAAMHSEKDYEDELDEYNDEKEYDEYNIPPESNLNPDNPAHQARAEVVGLGIKNLMEWVKENYPSIYNSINYIAILEGNGGLGLFINDRSVLAYLADKEFFYEFSEQVILKTGMKHICAIGYKGEIVWESDCVTANTPIKEDLFKYLPVQSREGSTKTQQSKSQLQDEFRSEMSSKSINFLDLFKQLPAEIKESSIPALLAVEAIQHATADWFKYQFSVTEIPEAELKATANKLYNKSVTNLIALCKD